MADQRQRTIFEIGIDDRQLKALDQTLHRTFDDQALASFERTLDRAARTMDRMLRVTEKMDQVLRRMAGGAGGAAGAAAGAAGGGSGPAAVQAIAGGGGGGGGARARGADGRFLGVGGAGAGGGGGFSWGGGSTQQRQRRRWLRDYGQRLTANAVSGSGFVAQAMGAIPLVGPVLAGAVNATTGYYNKYAAQQTAMSQFVGTAGTNSAGLGLAQFGMDRGAAAGFGAQVASASGRSGAGLRGLLGAAGAAQSYGGVQNGGTELIRAAETALGGERNVGGSRRDLYGTAGIGAARLSGMRDVDISRFTGEIANAVTQNRVAGGNADVSNALQLVTGLSGLGRPGDLNTGLTGQAGLRAATNIMGGMSNFTPGNNVGSMLMMDAAGFNGSGEGATYSEAQARINSADFSVFEGVRQRILDMTGGPGEAANIAMNALLPGMFNGLGSNMNQAISIANGTFDPAEIQTMLEEGQGYVAERQQQVGGSFTVPAREARQRDREADIGERVQELALVIRETETVLAETFLPAVARAAVGLINFVKEVTNLYLDGDVTGAGRRLLEGPGEPETPAEAEARVRQMRQQELTNPAGGNARGPLGPLLPGVNPVTASASVPELHRQLADAYEADQQRQLPSEGASSIV